MEDKREKEEEQLGEAFRLWYGADTCACTREGRSWAGKGPSANEELVRNELPQSSLPPSRITSPCTAALLTCQLGQLPKPGAVGSMHSLQQVFPEWIAEWCAIMVSTCRHWFPSSVAAWAEIYDSQPGHYIRAAKFSLHKYSFQMTYPITFIRKFLREKISTSYQVKNVS